MNKLTTSLVCKTGYVLRFDDLFNCGHWYEFPCDAEGNVAIATMSARGRDSYAQALEAVGRELSLPIIACTGVAMLRDRRGEAAQDKAEPRAKSA